jgi:hypothetical protein
MQWSSVFAVGRESHDHREGTGSSRPKNPRGQKSSIAHSDRHVIFDDDPILQSRRIQKSYGS